MASGRDLCAVAGACGIEIADLLTPELVASLVDIPLRDSLDDVMTRFLVVARVSSREPSTLQGHNTPMSFGGNIHDGSLDTLSMCAVAAPP
jgi:hypothetical protein